MGKTAKPLKIHFYVYKVKHLKSGMYYIGSRGSHKEPLEDIGVTYFTSSKYLMRDFKNNPHEYAIEILETCPDRAAAFSKERAFQESLDVIKDLKCFNKVISGVHIRPSRKGSIVSDELKKHYSDIHRRKMSEMTSEERSSKFGNHGIKNPFYGKQHPSDIREMITDKIRAYSKRVIENDPHFFLNKAMLAHTPEARKKRYDTTKIHLTVWFLDGKIETFDKFYHLSTYLDLSPTMGSKIFKNQHLMSKYKIIKMELKNED